MRRFVAVNRGVLITSSGTDGPWFVYDTFNDCAVAITGPDDLFIEDPEQWAKDIAGALNAHVDQTGDLYVKCD